MQRLDPFIWSFLALSMLAVIAWHLRFASPVGRRRIKWVAYGCGFLYLPSLVQAGLVIFGYGEAFDSAAFALGGIVLPLCLLLAVVRSNLLDIDRIISVTASSTILGFIALTAMLVLFPRAAALASNGLGLEPASGQTLLAVALAAIVIPAHRMLRPQIDRLLFSERYALERGVAELLRELSECGEVRTLCRKTGERLDDLLRPHSCLVYGRDGEGFALVFQRGGSAPPAFDAHDPLIAALARASRRLVRERLRPPGTRLTLFDRAALETLEATVILPLRYGERLIGFVSLGPKRSGDIYTETDLTLLEAVARKVEDEVIRLDLAETVRQGHDREEALRRYVPAAVTEQLASGGVEAAEHEVSVVFVDIRGYTNYAETRRAADVFSTVNRYAETVSAIARAHGGAVAEFSGDGMMIVFGAPRALQNKEGAAVAAGREIIAAVPQLDTGGSAATSLSVGVGIATGSAFVGDVQSVERRIWTAIGDTVNLAARLQQLTRPLEAAMVIDAVTWRRAGQVAADFVRRAETEIRGRSGAQDIWMLPIASGATISASRQ